MRLDRNWTAVRTNAESRRDGTCYESEDSVEIGEIGKKTWARNFKRLQHLVGFPRI